jgi:hypothetical protein
LSSLNEKNQNQYVYEHLKAIKLQSLKFTTSVKPANKNDGTGITNSITINIIVNREK